MPTKILQADTTPQEVFKTPYDKIGKIAFIRVDNRSANDVIVTVQDIFTPFPTDENPQPTEVTREVVKLTVKAGGSIDWQDKEKSVSILGTCKVVASVTSSDIDIVIGYNFE